MHHGRSVSGPHVWIPRLASYALFLTFAASCSSSGRTPFNAPGETDLSRVRHTIGFEVVCEDCGVYYITPDGSARARVRRSWRKNVRIWVTDMGAAVELTASPGPLGGSIVLARILVDGRAVAEQRGGNAFDLGSGIVLSAVVEREQGGGLFPDRDPVLGESPK